MEDLQRHLAALRGALDGAQAKAAPADVIARYAREVSRIEQLIANGGPREPEPVRTVVGEEYAPDSLLALVLRRYMPTNHDPKTEATAWLPPLPLLVPDVPAGLTPEETARHEAEAVDRIIRIWARVLAPQWKLSVEGKAALTRLAWVWCRGDRDECRRRLAYRGLCDALVAGHRPTRVHFSEPGWRGRRDRASRTDVRDAAGEIAEIVPAAQHDIAFLTWLAQAARRYARERLTQLAPIAHTEFDEVGEKGSPMVAWPREPETQEERLFADPGAVLPGEELIEVEDAEERRREAREELDRRRTLLPPAQLRILGALLDHMERTGEDYTEARKAVARLIAKGGDPDDIRRAETRVDQVLSKLRARRRKDERTEEE